MPEEDKNSAVVLHEDLSELSVFIKQRVDEKINSLMKKYAQ